MGKGSPAFREGCRIKKFAPQRREGRKEERRKKKEERTILL
jgi:hypothetical protein